MFLIFARPLDREDYEQQEGIIETSDEPLYSWFKTSLCAVVEKSMLSAGRIWNENIASFLALGLNGRVTDC